MNGDSKIAVYYDWKMIKLFYKCNNKIYYKLYKKYSVLYYIALHY